MFEYKIIMSSIAQQRKRINSKPIGNRQSQPGTIVRPQQRVIPSQQIVINNAIPSEHFVMMAKFLQFNKMTRNGMKDFTQRESNVYDRLIDIYNKLAKSNNKITQDNLDKIISKYIISV